MVKRESLALASLLCSVSGILALAALASQVEARPAKISELDESWLGTPVKLNAKVVSASQGKGMLFLELYDGTGKIRAVSFSPEEAGVTKGGFATFEGKVQLYKGELELVIEKAEGWG